MRTIFVILAIAVLGFAHDVFAQAPKEVIVVDGQIAVNNGPVNPASVMVENGITNPVPIIDLTPQAGETFVFGFATAQGPDTNFIEFEIFQPGKLFKLVGLSATLSGHQDSEFSFQLSNVGFAHLPPNELATIHLGASHSILTGGVGRIGIIFKELNDFPLLRQFSLSGIRARPTGASHTNPIELNGQVWGYLVDDPAL